MLVPSPIVWVENIQNYRYQINVDFELDCWTTCKQTAWSFSVQRCKNIFKVLNLTLNLTFKWTQNEVKLIDLELSKSNLIEFQSPFLPISDPLKMISSVSNHSFVSTMYLQDKNVTKTSRISCQHLVFVNKNKVNSWWGCFELDFWIGILVLRKWRCQNGELDEPRNYTLTKACIMNFKIQTLFKQLTLNVTKF